MSIKQTDQIQRVATKSSHLQSLHQNTMPDSIISAKFISATQTASKPRPRYMDSPRGVGDQQLASVSQSVVHDEPQRRHDHRMCLTNAAPPAITATT